MGKTQQAKGPTLFSRSRSLASLRHGVGAPQVKRQLDYIWRLPENGVIDLSAHPDHQPLDQKLIPCLAPLSAVTENAEQAAQLRGFLLNEVEQRIFGNPSFLGQEYQTSDPNNNIGLYARASVTTIDRQRDEGMRASRQLSPDIDCAPLEILVQEKYTPANPANSWDYGIGIGHYVYDPLTDRWLLVKRWGRGEMKKRSQTIEPYMQHGALVNRRHKALEEIESGPGLQSPEDQDWERADEQLIESRFSEIRQARARRT